MTDEEKKAQWVEVMREESERIGRRECPDGPLFAAFATVLSNPALFQEAAQAAKERIEAASVPSPTASATGDAAPTPPRP